MKFTPLPASAAWRHVDAREGFEVVFISAGSLGLRFEGQTSAVEDGEAWSVEYVIELGQDWLTRRAHVSSLSSAGKKEVVLDADGNGRWRINGEAAPHLDGLLDVDLESSAVTNAFPVHRLAMAVGESHDAPAAYVRALDLSVMRLEQRYRRLPDTDRGQAYAYLAPAFDADFTLVYDPSGLVLDYPFLARRVQ